MSPSEEDVAVVGSRSRDSDSRAAWNILTSRGQRVLVRGDPSYVDYYVMVLCTGGPTCSCAWGVHLAGVFMLWYAAQRICGVMFHRVASNRAPTESAGDSGVMCISGQFMSLCRLWQGSGLGNAHSQSARCRSSLGERKRERRKALCRFSNFMRVQLGRP